MPLRRLVQLSIAKSEGYTDVKITGSRLDMDTDFKVWLGIIRSMSEYGVKVTPWNCRSLNSLRCVDLTHGAQTRKCGDRISNSLFKLASVTLQFQSETKGWTTHLVQSAYYDINEDIVEIKAEPKLFELYHMDRRVLLRLKAIDALQRKESAPGAVYLHREPSPESRTYLHETYAGPAESYLKCLYAEPHGPKGYGATSGYRLSGLHRV
ncbi:initiator replication protein RepB [Klebsiella pneumoniae]|uniref:Initiator replication protein RepB n=1 Tax=Klebsiella pneumoniae TaxID=573 RepID=A0A2X3BW14_KLEPN|nr:initiator replication protein RepB [Klebsiella pneumoniae]